MRIRSTAAKARSIDISGYPLGSGFCAALLALSMGVGGNASAWPTPAGACVAENDGEYAMTSGYSLLYVGYAAYVCSNSARGLLDVSRCDRLLVRCAPL